MEITYMLYEWSVCNDNNNDSVEAHLYTCTLRAHSSSRMSSVFTIILTVYKIVCTLCMEHGESERARHTYTQISTFDKHLHQ